MDRRAFIAGAAVAGAAPVVAQAQSLDPNAGQTVTVRGYLKRISNHVYAIGQTAQVTDPKSPRYQDWPRSVIRVYPRSTGGMVLGLVTIRGKLFEGNQIDAPSRTAATRVMTDAVMA